MMMMTMTGAAGRRRDDQRGNARCPMSDAALPARLGLRHSTAPPSDVICTRHTFHTFNTFTPLLYSLDSEGIPHSVKWGFTVELYEFYDSSERCSPPPSPREAGITHMATYLRRAAAPAPTSK